GTTRLTGAAGAARPAHAAGTVCTGRTRDALGSLHAGVQDRTVDRHRHQSAGAPVPTGASCSTVAPSDGSRSRDIRRPRSADSAAASATTPPEPPSPPAPPAPPSPPAAAAGPVTSVDPVPPTPPMPPSPPTPPSPPSDPTTTSRPIAESVTLTEIAGPSAPST